MKRVIGKSLGQLLVERGVITADQLNQALEKQRKSGTLLGECLVAMGFAREEDVAQALTAQYGFPYLPLKNYEIDPALIKLIPEMLARNYCLIPVDKIGDVLSVAMADPLNTQAVDDVEFITHCKVQSFIATPADIKDAISRYYAKA